MCVEDMLISLLPIFSISLLSKSFSKMIIESLKCVQIFLITNIEFVHKKNSDYQGIEKLREKQN